MSASKQRQTRTRRPKTENDTADNVDNNTPCDNGKCDTTKCDAGKCDTTKCDMPKCDATKCDNGKCDMTQCDGEGNDEPMDDGMMSESKDSVVNFDRKEVPAWNSMKVSDLTDEQLLKVLICRGENLKNPVLSGGCKRVLKQINGERFPRRPGFVRGNGRRAPMNLSSSGPGSNFGSDRPSGNRFGNSGRFNNNDRQERFNSNDRSSSYRQDRRDRPDRSEGGRDRSDAPRQDRRERDSGGRDRSEGGPRQYRGGDRSAPNVATD